MNSFSFPRYPEPQEVDALRQEVRAFLHDELGARTPVERAQSWSGADPAFSARLGAQGSA
jgi:hypothetical protein